MSSRWRRNSVWAGQNPRGRPWSGCRWGSRRRRPSSICSLGIRWGWDRGRGVRPQSRDRHRHRRRTRHSSQARLRSTRTRRILLVRQNSETLVLCSCSSAVRRGRAHTVWLPDVAYTRTRDVIADRFVRACRSCNASVLGTRPVGRWKHYLISRDNLMRGDSQHAEHKDQ